MKRILVPALVLSGLVFAIPAALHASAKSPASPPSGAGPAPSAPPPSWQRLEQDLDSLFRDSMADLAPVGHGQGVAFSSSIDLREKPDAYVARIYVPKADQSKVNVKYEDGHLRVQAGEQGPDAYDETIAIPGPVKADAVRIEPRKGIVVVTLPKDTSAEASATPAVPMPDQWDPAWDHQVMRRMQRMEDRMDQLTRDMMSDMKVSSDVSPGSYFGSTVNLQDRKNDYVVHFYLPDKDLSDLKAEVKDGRLELSMSDASKQATDTGSGRNVEERRGEFREMLSLPGPVKADQMKIDRGNGALTVTIPKA